MRTCSVASGPTAFTAPVGLGPDAPEAGEELFIKDLVKTPDPTSPYGEYAYGLSGSDNDLDAFTVSYLSADLHTTPSRIPDAVEERLLALSDGYDDVFVAYGDCGTAGRLDAVLERLGATRLPGAHCYEFLASSTVFAQLHDAEPTTFYVTDFLLRQFDRLVWRGLGLDRCPYLRDHFFGKDPRTKELVGPDGLQGAAKRDDRTGDRVSVLRGGQSVGEVPAAGAAPGDRPTRAVAPRHDVGRVRVPRRRVDVVPVAVVGAERVVAERPRADVDRRTVARVEVAAVEDHVDRGLLERLLR